MYRVCVCLFYERYKRFHSQSIPYLQPSTLIHLLVGREADGINKKVR